jgi:hypothetical protein
MLYSVLMLCSCGVFLLDLGVCDLCCRAVVVRWHSFQRGSTRPDSYLFRAVETGRGVVQGSRPMASLSSGQLLVLRKLALLKLTACMERYCPTHRTGWNWELPKFIRKIKTPDYKGELMRIISSCIRMCFMYFSFVIWLRLSFPQLALLV